MTNNDPHIISTDATLLEALDRLNRLSGGVMTLMAIDGEGVMRGTLTDGDIRRALLRGADTTTRVAEVMHKEFKRVTDSDNIALRLRELRLAGIKLVPRLDNSGRIAELYDLTVRRSDLPIRAILMAGGRGERLRPLTIDTPKPLLKIGGKPIIDYNVEALVNCGVEDIFVTTNYLAGQLDAHFATPVDGVTVRCVREPEPLGTIGSVALVPQGRGDHTLVMNSDLLTTISFEDLYLHHISRGADITIATFPYHVSVPFAVMALDGDNVMGLTEKPTYTYQANAGIYIFSNEILDTIRPGERMDAPDLISRAIGDGRRVSCFPINGLWIDIGSPEDFRQAEQTMERERPSTR
ncbi:MAG: sugar phosphate nucleotidyltransferase [Pseudoflavonifractor sp.]|nr:sugar phosphate nucleotidyltransferase [Pseudoflavonifractor sp.]